MSHDLGARLALRYARLAPTTELIFPEGMPSACADECVAPAFQWAGNDGVFGA